MVQWGHRYPGSGDHYEWIFQTKQALVAIAHKLIKACWHIIKYKVAYKEIGESFIPKDKKDKITKYYIKKLHQFGYEVQLGSNQ